MPPDTPSTIARPRSMVDSGLLLRRRRRVLVGIGNFAADHALQRGGGDLAEDGLAGAPRPVVQSPRLTGGNDGKLVFVGAGGRNEGRQLGHAESPLGTAGRKRATRARSASTIATSRCTARSSASFTTR